MSGELIKLVPKEIMKANSGKIIGILIVLMGLIGLSSQLIKIENDSEISYAKILLSIAIAAYGFVKIRSVSGSKDGNKT